MGNNNSENKMSEEQRQGSKNTNNIQENEKQYYTDLYNDLPREVVDILMQTHPLMGKAEEADAAAYRTRRPQQRDMDVIKKERMNKVGQEIQKEMVQLNPERAMDSPQRIKNEKKRQATPQNNRPQDKLSSRLDENHSPEDERIQFVQIRGDYQSKAKQNMSEQPSNPKKKAKKQPREEFDFGKGNVNANRKNHAYKDIDFDAKAKEEELNRLYDDDFEDDEKISLGDYKKIILFSVVVLFVVGFLGYKCVSLSTKLEKAQEELSSMVDINDKYETARMEILTLKDEINRLNGGEPAAGDGTENGDIISSDEYDVYTATASDTYWGMAQKFYGNGTEYTIILEANGLTENDSVKAGQRYKIPKKKTE